MRTLSRAAGFSNIITTSLLLYIFDVTQLLRELVVLSITLLTGAHHLRPVYDDADGPPR